MAKRDRPQPVTVEPLKAYARREPRPNGVWYWQIGVSVAGTLKAIIDGEGRALSGWYTRQDVRRKLQETAAADDWRFSDGKRPDKGPAPIVTLEDLLFAWGDYQSRRASLRADTRRSYVDAASRVGALLSGIPIAEVTGAHLEDAIEAARCKHGDRTVHRDFLIVRQAWKWGRARKHVPERDLPPMTLPQPSKAPRKYNHCTPTDDEIEQVIATLKGFDRAMGMLLWYTGARCSELSRLTWDKVHLDGEEPFIDVVAKTSTGTHDGVHRRLDLDPDLVAVLREWRAERPAISGPVWHLDLRSARATIRRTLTARSTKLEGVPTFTPHGLRRRRITEAIADGIDAKSYEAMFGNTYEEGLRTYAQVQRERVKEAAKTALRPKRAKGEEKAKPAKKRVLYGPWRRGK